MGERIRAFDWWSHPLGPPDGWPQSLRIAIRIMLTSRYAMWLGWGPEFFFFCNDAYLPTVGIKENWVLGTSARKVWAEIWDAIGPRAESVVNTGHATWDESLRLFLERSGYAEETYHTFSYSPVPADDGSIGGMLCVVTEDTERVIGERRLALLRELASDLSGQSTEQELFTAVQRRLGARPEDLPFALVYLFDGRTSQARLAGRHGVEGHAPLAPETISTGAPSQVWPATAVLEHAAEIVLEDLAARFPTLPTGLWEKPPRQAIVVPIAQQGTEQPAGFLVAGINPFRPLDAAYTGFLHLLAGQIAAALSNVRAYEAERRRAEALAELDRAKTTFFSNVSHELRTPLTLMLAPMEEILKWPAGSLPADVRSLATVAQRNGVRLLKLVNTILDFSRIEAGRVHAAFAPTDLARATTELASSFRSAIERAGLEFVVDCPPLPEPVYVDGDMWEKIVLNLLSNAFKFTLQGRIAVSLRHLGECVEFSVEDTGAGIPAEAHPHLFERFYRVRGAQGRSHEGTGIGLALVHELVKFHGGSLHVESEPGVGSTFTVFLRTGHAHLPAQSVTPTEAAPGLRTATAFVEEASQWDAGSALEDGETGDFSSISGSGGRVLVVDDNADMRRYVARLLSTRFQVVGAPEGLAALDALQREKPDLILTDVMMPNLDGFGLLKAVRSRPEWRTIPVILLSARAGEESRVEGLDAGADDFLVKPFSGRELLARVNVHLQMARIRGQAEESERALRTEAETYASALRESTERLSASLTAAGTGTFRWDLRTHALDFDPALDRLYGLPAGQRVRSVAEATRLLHPDDRARIAAARQRFANEGSDFDLEFRVLLSDDSIRWLNEKGKTFFDESGKPSYVTGACVDVTKRKQTEAFVWRQKDVLEQIVQGAPLVDVLETLTLDVEQIAERRLIATVLAADAEGRVLNPIAGRRAPPGWNRIVEGLPIAPSTGSCGTAAFLRERVIVRDVMNSPLWGEVYRTPAVKHNLRACWSTPILSSGGTVLGTFAIYYPEPAVPTDAEVQLVDIVARTAAIAFERDRAGAALRASQAQLAQYAHQLEERVQERTAKLQETVSELESFSYSISHDMRAPLRAMQSFAQILEEDCVDQISPQGRDYLRRIIGASHRMDRLIQDVLTYSRVTRTELQLVPVDVEKLLDGILESYPQFQLPYADVELVRPLPRVMANEAALTQCFSNLIGNAIKFVVAPTVPEVRIWCDVVGSRARIHVRDNGIGIDPDAHEKIFHIFYQLDRNYEGTGIGLSVVRKAAERMGGSIGLQSEPNRGSTFHLELQLAPDP